MSSEVPTGSDEATVSDYYDYLYEHYLRQIDQTFDLEPITLLWWGFWLALLVGGVGAAVWWQRSTRATSEPYPVESYNGYITEGNGPVGGFLTVFFIGVVIWLLAITVAHLVQGQIY